MGVPFVAGGAIFLFVAFVTGAATLSNNARELADEARAEERWSICNDPAAAPLSDAQKAGLAAACGPRETGNP